MQMSSEHPLLISPSKRGRQPVSGEKWSPFAYFPYVEKLFLVSVLFLSPPL